MWGLNAGCPVVRTGGRCTVTWLPNFLGWVDLLTHGAPQARFARQSSAISFPSLILPPPHFCRFLSITTTTSFLLFVLHYHHHYRISIVFRPPPLRPHFYCLSCSTTTTTFELFSLHHPHDHISMFGNISSRTVVWPFQNKTPSMLRNVGNLSF